VRKARSMAGSCDGLAERQMPDFAMATETPPSSAARRTSQSGGRIGAIGRGNPRGRFGFSIP
jgi:hypothetical protein